MTTLTARQFWRDFRSGELTLLLVSAILAVAVVTSISIFAERIRLTLVDQAGTLLAADYALQGSRPIPDEWRAQASELGLEQADVTSFTTMLFGDEGNQLGSVRAVSEAYPLLGTLEVAAAPFGDAQEVAHGPPPGQIWLASRLFPLLGIEPGDAVSVGATTLTATRALISEPDQTSSLFNIEPRAMIHQADLAATGAVQPGSRVTYRWLLAGNEQSLRALRDNLRGSIEPHYRWRSAERANDNIGEAMDRAQEFLLLAGSLAVILAGVALAMSAQRYTARHTDTVALLKTLGMTPQRITRLYGLGLLVVAVTAVVIGIAAGDLAHRVIVALLADLLPDNLAAHGPGAYLLGAATGLLAVLGFAWPPFYRLRSVPPARVLRSDVWQQRRATDQLWGAAAIIGLVWLYSRDVTLTAILVSGGALCLAGAALFARGLLWGLRRLGGRLGRSWRLGLASLQRNSRQSGLQVVIFAIAFMLLFTLALVRTSLLEEWQRQLPENTPNHFVYNVFPEELPQLNAWLDDYASNESPAYPIVRGRLTRVNDTGIDELTENLPDRGDYRRELNMTWSDEYGADNAIESGSWWENYGAGPLRVSVEQDFAEDIGITVGDTLFLSLGGEAVSAEVASLRSLDWESFNPNFYLIFNQPIGAPDSAFYLISFYLSPDNKPALTELIRAIPSISVLEVDALLEQIQSIIAQVTLAVEFILVLILAAGLLVLVAGIQSTLDVRYRESALLRTMGAPGALLRRTLAIEFGALGALSGLLGAFGAEWVLFYLQGELFNMDTGWHPWLWVVAPFAGMLVIGLVGVGSTLKVALTPPMRVLGQWVQ